VENYFSQGCYPRAAAPELVSLPMRMALRGGDGLISKITKMHNFEM
jgi:hypothetical protein